MALRYASARHVDAGDRGYGPAPGRSEARMPRSEAVLPLPDLAEVARRLAASHFVCVAACHVMKPPTDDGHGGHEAEDVRVLAVGYSAGSASVPELLKISSTPAFSLLRSWKTLVAGAPPAPRGVGPLRVTRRWSLADLSEVQLGPPGGGFLLRFRGASRDACFVPLRRDGGGDAAAALLSACARAAAAAGARLPRGTLAALAGPAGREAATSSSPDAGGPLPWGIASASTPRSAAASPALAVDGYSPQWGVHRPSAPPRSASADIAADALAMRLAERAAALDAELGGSLPPDVIAEHLAAEAQLRGEFAALSGGAPASPSSASARAAAAAAAQQAAWQAASRGSSRPLPPVYTAQVSPPAATSAGGDWEQWEAVPPEAMAPPPLARAPPPPPRSVPAASPAAQDADALVERLAAEACLLRAAFDGGADMRSPAVLRAANACADGCAALRRLIAGHFGSAHWTPPAAGGGLLAQAPPAQGRAALWVALHGDISALLQQTGHGGDAAGTAAAAGSGTGATGWSEPPASSSDDDGGGPSSSDDDSDAHWRAPPPPPSMQQPRASMAPLIDLSDAPAPPPPPPSRAPPPPPPPRPAPPPTHQQAASPQQASLAALQRAPSSGAASASGCCVCLERPVETALLNCGHAVACLQCANALVAARSGCPCCRSPISRVARIYM